MSSNKKDKQSSDKKARERDGQRPRDQGSKQGKEPGKHGKDGKRAKRPEEGKRERATPREAVEVELATRESRRAVDDVDLRVRELQLRIGMLQEQFVGVLIALGESTDRLQAAVALIADLPTRDAATDSARELRRRLEQMLVTQQRTNELLDLALGVAAAPDPPRR